MHGMMVTPLLFSNFIRKTSLISIQVRKYGLNSWDKIKELYESLRGKVKMDRFEMINPLKATDTMAVLTYNLHSYSGETLWKVYGSVQAGRK